MSLLKNDKNQNLPPVHTQKRYSTSIPQGRLSQVSMTQIPVIQSRRGLSSKRDGQPLTTRQFMTDPSLIDKKLKSMSQNNTPDFRITLQSQRKQKANLKFLKYKFNPGLTQDAENFNTTDSDAYGQLSANKKQKISINTFYQHKNVLFQDQRAPEIYKKLFLEKNEIYQ